MKVSVAVVAYNEEKTLPKLLEDLSAQDYPHEKIEVLLIDSMSTDSTIRIMREFSENSDFSDIKLLKNENKTLPYGCNVMLENYTGEVIVRLDAHTSIPIDFISNGVAVLKSGEDISGGQVVSVCADDKDLSKTMLIVENSVFCGGVAKFRRVQQREYVNTMAFAFYKREVYEKVGKYNINLARTEDNDMSYRIIQAGYKFCLDPSIKSVRYNRSTFKGMLRQKYFNGYWIGKTLGINPKCFSLFHFVPFLFVLGIILTSVLAVFAMPILSLLMWAAYAVVIVCASALEIAKNKFVITNLLLPILFLVLHISYGIGTLVGLIEMPFWLRKIKKGEA